MLTKVLGGQPRESHRRYLHLVNCEVRVLDEFEPGEGYKLFRAILHTGSYRRLRFETDPQVLS